MTPPVLAELRTWQRIRRYAVPAAMIEACTVAREAGDWRAACAAGRIDVGFDLADVRREHGRKIADLIEADLAVLAPDLLRWHLPRALGGRTSLATYQKYLLSVRDGRIGESDPALVLHLPKTVDGSQRLRLTVGPVGDKDGRNPDLPPPFWSAAHVDGLAVAYGGSAARLPGFEPDGRVRPFEAYPTTVDPSDPASRVEAFDRQLAAGDLGAAWAVTGIELDLGTAQLENRRNDQAVHYLSDRCVPVGLDAELARLHARYGSSPATVGDQWQVIAKLDRREDGSLDTSLVGYDHRNFALRRIASVVYGRPADLELVRHGLLDPAELHPLVRRSLFPGTPTAAIPVHNDLKVDVAVRCQGHWHAVTHADGRLTPVSHSSEEVSREKLLRTLGGQVSGCFAAVEAWHGSAGRLPRRLRELRREVLQRIQHEGSAALAGMLDAGLDPRMTDGRGGTLLHNLRAVGDVTLVRRLVDAGVPIGAPNRRGRTALHVAVGDGGTPELVRALLEAGADPRATDGDGMTVAEVAEWKSANYYGEDDDTDGKYQQTTDNRALIDEWVAR